MNIYLDLLLITAAVTYVVDVSGFTTSWRSLLARALSRPGHTIREEDLRPLKPFDCGKCMTFWTCLGYAIATGQTTLPVLAACCAASLLSKSFSGVMIFLCESIDALLDMITPKR